MAKIVCAYRALKTNNGLQKTASLVLHSFLICAEYSMPFMPRTSNMKESQIKKHFVAYVRLQHEKFANS
jgi:hypothetical protein